MLNKAASLYFYMYLRHINHYALCNNISDIPTLAPSLTETNENTELPVNLPTDSSGSNNIYLPLILAVGTVLICALISTTYFIYR